MNRKHIAQETIAALEQGSYTAPSGSTIDISSMLKACVDRTQCYPPDTLSPIRDQILAQPPLADHTTIELVNETTLQGAARLTAAGTYQRIGVLNFASARNPGGGFLGGAQAQEESLARSSGLYSSLLHCPGYYAHHRQLRTCLYSDWMIFSPDCPVFRTDRGHWLETPYTVSLITSPAPNAGAIRSNEPHNLPQIPAVFRERISKLLALAAYHACDALILGAWGCGAFHNDPQTVAALFAEQLCPTAPFWGRFPLIRFSVLDTSPAQNIYAAFAHHFPEIR